MLSRRAGTRSASVEVHDTVFIVSSKRRRHHIRPLRSSASGRVTGKAGRPSIWALIRRHGRPPGRIWRQPADGCSSSTRQRGPSLRAARVTTL